DCPLEICIEREKLRTDKADIENLYERALMGQIRIAGVGYPYAEEENPLLRISSDKVGAIEAARMIFNKLVPDLQLDPESSSNNYETESGS
ncbi:MAG: hypothetical protein GY839_01560, partial [candidate division Zixibacteria bacterium]|nr:hypothetical protein [candidate division Zixibacteria bacterium]